jgi:hypothetical protein
MARNSLANFNTNKSTLKISTRASVVRLSVAVSAVPVPELNYTSVDFFRKDRVTVVLTPWVQSVVGVPCVHLNLGRTQQIKLLLRTVLQPHCARTSELARATLENFLERWMHRTNRISARACRLYLELLVGVDQLTPPDKKMLKELCSRPKKLHFNTSKPNTTSFYQHVLPALLPHRRKMGGALWTRAMWRPWVEFFVLRLVPRDLFQLVLSFLFNRSGGSRLRC